ncbi:TPA: GNAT family N-acetyltransferase [Legionella pneumophila]|uniref:GNAT family N-acetyltransferase n=1 Tax=Legionella pneumophila TaxID=446 RepID=UPI0013752D34|nr:N-acetyltransferase [Legionella pneumophila]HAT9703085.1 N-acetyltransferase [Legionella pneumophila subsp. pneumophila]MDI0469822.1 N-acetyltransferase [Legionella pneumophila]HAT8742754.1 N-acetyltransferase [Legionella pneumophila]HAU1444120.1 N-acetyltransferase [Legionella pneumophila]HBI2978871.1 N-acetyltransferase [Legionella pneumophila]
MVVIKKLDELHIDELSSYLNHYQETTMFIRNNLYHSGITYQDAPFHGDYYGSFKNNKLNGVLAHYWNGNVMMQAETLSELSALVEVFESKRTRPVAGILGEDNQANFVIEKLGIQSSQFALNCQEKLFLLNLKEMITPKAIHSHSSIIKPLQDCEMSLIKEWLIAYEIEALGGDANDPKLEQSIIDEIEDVQISQNRWVLFIDDIPVSLCGFNATLPNMVQIGPVYTPPPLRNNSFARIAVYLCLKQAASKQVARAILFTKDSSAMRAYCALGFNQIGNYRLALLK